MPYAPIDAAIINALDVPVPSKGPAHAHSSQEMNVAIAPQASALIVDNQLCEDADAKTAWDAVRLAMRNAYPTSAWPVGLRLVRRARHDAWSSWSLHRVFLFGHAIDAERVGIDFDNATYRWREQPIGFDALADQLTALDVRIPRSNGAPRSFCEAHNMMGTPYVNTRRVVARCEAEAMAKMAWAHGGLDAIADLFTSRPRNHRTWLVANELADFEHDGFAHPAALHDPLDQLRALTPPV